MKLEKTTKIPGVDFKRRYNDACAAAHALDLIGDRWALLVLRELMIGPRRFSDVKAGLPGISANILTQRLAELEAVGLLTRRELPPPAAARVYELTRWGYEAEPILKVLGMWAARSPLHDPAMAFSPASFVLSLRTMFSPARAGYARLRIGFRVTRGDGAPVTCVAEVAAGEFTFEPAPLDGVETVVTGAPEAIAGVIYGGMALTDMIAAEALAVTGNAAEFERFATWFPLPDKADLTEGT